MRSIGANGECSSPQRDAIAQLDHTVITPASDKNPISAGFNETVLAGVILDQKRLDSRQPMTIIQGESARQLADRKGSSTKEVQAMFVIRSGNNPLR